MATLEILNPVAETAKFDVKPAPRLADLRGKTIGLYWNMKAGGDVALDAVEELLRKRIEGASFKRFIGSVGFTMRHATAEDAERMAREAHAVVGTTSD